MKHAGEGAKPLALTMGDACGIGPEIIAQVFRAAAASDVDDVAAGAFVLGDLGVMRRAAALTGGLLPVAYPEPADQWFVGYCGWHGDQYSAA